MSSKLLYEVKVSSINFLKRRKELKILKGFLFKRTIEKCTDNKIKLQSVLKMFSNIVITTELRWPKLKKIPNNFSIQSNGLSAHLGK